MKLSTSKYLIEIDTSGGNTTLNIIDIQNQISHSEIASTGHFNFADAVAALTPPIETQLQQKYKVYVKAQEKFNTTLIDLEKYKRVDDMGALDDPADLTDKIADFKQIQQELKQAKADYEALIP